MNGTSMALYITFNICRHGALSDNDLYEQVTHENTDDDDYE